MSFWCVAAAERKEDGAIFTANSLLQSVLLLLVHLHHDFVLLLQDLQLVLNVALLALEGGDAVLQLLVLFCCGGADTLSKLQFFLFL